MDKFIDKVCSYCYNNISIVTAVVIIIALLVFNRISYIEYKAKEHKLEQAQKYINLLESDLGEDYILDVATSTDEYQDYYNY